MIERCVKYTLQYGRGWQVDETREVSNFDEKGNPVASNHFVLVGGNEAVDEKTYFDPEERREAAVELAQTDRQVSIQRAIEKLDPDNDQHWTKDGLPSVAQIFNEVGFDVTRADINEAAPGFDRKIASG